MSNESGGRTPFTPTSSQGANDLEVSIVMPCLNEEQTIGACVQEARETLERLGLRGEIIVADNGSADRSAEIASGLGARVVPILQKGYGSALMGGIAAARGRFVVMGDSDRSYDFTEIGAFVEKLREGNDLVMGNRFQGGIAPGAMPPLHRYLGNPVLTSIGRLLFKSQCGDFHCGMRAFRKEVILNLGLRTTGMEFASEMIVKATLFGLRIAEVPTTLRPDRRNRAPHLRTWRDGWRHLRFLLLYSPRWLFLYPGFLLMVLGAAVGVWVLPGPQVVGGVTFDIHTLLFAAVLVLVGFQSANYAVFSKIFAITEGLAPEDYQLSRLFARIKLETGLLVGAILIVVGIAAWALAFGSWGRAHLGPLDPRVVMRLTIPGALCLVLGSEIVLSSFFLSILGMARK